MSDPFPIRWPFDQPPNCATITVRRVLQGLDPITLVSHDADDHGWQFLNSENGGSPDVKDGAVVCLSHILELDPTVREVADLPPGWRAWRTGVGAPWHREPRPDDELDS